MIFKPLEFNNMSDNISNKKILALGGDPTGLSQMTNDIVTDLNRNLGFGEVVVVNGDKWTKEILGKKFDDIDFIYDEQLVNLNKIISEHVLNTKMTYRPIALVIFTSHKIEQNERLLKLLQLFKICNTTLIISSTHPDPLVDVNVENQFDMVMSQYHWDDKTIYNRYFRTYSTLNEFRKAFLCMTMDSNAMVIKYKMYCLVVPHLSDIFQYIYDKAKYATSDSDDESPNSAQDEELDVLNVFNTKIILKL